MNSHRDSFVWPIFMALLRIWFVKIYCYSKYAMLLFLFTIPEGLNVCSHGRSPWKNEHSVNPPRRKPKSETNASHRRTPKYNLIGALSQPIFFYQRKKLRMKRQIFSHSIKTNLRCKNLTITNTNPNSHPDETTPLMTFCRAHPCCIKPFCLISALAFHLKYCK